LSTLLAEAGADVPDLPTHDPAQVAPCHGNPTSPELKEAR
jgi:hypothetical protein